MPAEIYQSDSQADDAPPDPELAAELAAWDFASDMTLLNCDGWE